MDISDIIQIVNDRTGLKCYSGDDEKLKVEVIPFGIPPLDNRIGGGLPRGRIIIIDGEFQSGKTFLCQQVIKSAQNFGLSVAYFNVEQKLDPDWFVKTGIDISNIAVIQGNVAESIFDSVMDLIENGVGVIILDSLTAMVPISESEDEMDKQTIGLQARVFSKGFRKMVGKLSDSQTTVVITSQKRSGMGPYSPDLNPGGKASYFYSSLILNVRRKEWKEDENKEKIGYMMAVKSMKNNIAVPWRECAFPFYFVNGGVDMVEIVAEEAVSRKIVEKSGAWFYYGSEKFHGWNVFLSFLRNNDQILAEIQEKLDRKTG